MTVIHLVRHGETIWHAENRYAGSSDVALNDRGLAQADHLGRWASSASLDAVVCSSLSRAIATARPVERATSLTARVDADLREIDFGEGEGMNAAEMQEAFPTARADFERSPASSPLPGGEPGAVAAARFRAALDRVIAREQPDATVLVVAHSTIIRVLLCHELGLPLDDYRRRLPRLDNVALTTIRVLADAPTALLRLNAPLPQPND